MRVAQRCPEVEQLAGSSMDGDYWKSAGDKGSRKDRRRKVEDAHAAADRSMSKKKKRGRKSSNGMKGNSKRKKRVVAKKGIVSQGDVADETQTQDSVPSANVAGSPAIQVDQSTNGVLKELVEALSQHGVPITLNVTINQNFASK